MEPDAQRSSDPRRPFVGRDGELQALASSVGQGRLFLISGDPGIGKTRLVEELAASAVERHALVRWGRCWEDEGAPAFWPWIEIVRGLVRESDPETLRARLGGSASDVAQIVTEVRAQLPDLPDPPRVDAKQARFRLFDGITTFLKAVAASQPLVVILEDLHWADAPSLLLLQFLAREIDAAPLLVIATFREAGRSGPLAETFGALVRHRHCEHLPLTGLSATDVRRYVEIVAGGETAERFAASLHHDTDGNPFLLGEMVRLLARQPANVGPGEPRAAILPDTVRDVIVRRLRGYSAECVDTLRVASVVGHAFTLALLQRLPDLGGRALLEILGEALDGRLIVETQNAIGEYRFAHSLIRDTLYEDLPLARRIDLHRSVGEALAARHPARSGPHAAELAHHFLQAAGGGSAELAIEYAMGAGQHATTVLAHEEAVAHYTRALRALELWLPADERRAGTVLLALGEALVRAGDPASAEEAFLRAARLARVLDAPELLARAALGLGEIERFHDRLVPLLEDALVRLGPDDRALRVRLLSRLAVTLYWSQPNSRKTTLSEEAVAMARRLGDAGTLAYALAGRIATLSGPDDVEERLAAASEMRDLADGCGDRELAMVARGWWIADSLALARIERVRQEIDAFATAAAELRHPYYAWWSTAIRVMQTLLDGRFAAAEALAEEAFALGQRAVVSDAMQVFAGHLYVLCIEQERLDQLASIAHAFVQQFPRIPGGHCALALLHAERGQVAEAEAEMAAVAADDFAALPRNPEWLGCIGILAATSVLLPDAPYADVLYGLLTPYRRRVIVAGLGVLCSGSVAHFLGMLATRLGRWDDAAAHLDEALRVHERIGAVPWIAYTQYESARLALARRAPGDVERAATLRAAALQCAEALGMTRLRRHLIALDAETERGESPTRRHPGTLHQDGDYWIVRWGPSEFRLRDSVGLHYLATLIGNPTREFLAIDLVTTCRSRRTTRAGNGGAAHAVEAGLPRSIGDAGPLLDEKARSAYRRRLADLRTALGEAQAFNDLARITRTQAEIDALADELSRAVGLGGRDRRAASPVERARVSATRAIRATVRRIRQNDAALGHHLAVAIKTGTFCSYLPDDRIPVAWTL